MALDNFIPEVWSGSILSNLSKSLVFGQPGVINTDYEGEITGSGDTVHINSIGRPTVKPYTKNNAIDDPEVLTDAQRSLLIDQAQYFNFMVDDVDAAQQKPKVMREATQESAYSLRDVADKFIASLYTDAARNIGSDSSPEVVAAADAYDYLVDLSTLLDEKYTDANGVEQGGVPDEGRFVVVTPSFYGKLRKDNRFVNAEKSGSTMTLRNGQVGEAAGFNVMKSNNAPHHTGDGGTTTTSNDKIIAGHSMAWTYAEQINKTEAYRPEGHFSDALKGLHLYGAKVVRPYALAVLSVDTTQ